MSLAMFGFKTFSSTLYLIAKKLEAILIYEIDQGQSYCLESPNTQSPSDKHIENKLFICEYDQSRIAI